MNKRIKTPEEYEKYIKTAIPEEPIFSPEELDGRKISELSSEDLQKELAKKEKELKSLVVRKNSQIQRYQEALERAKEGEEVFYSDFVEDCVEGPSLDSYIVDEYKEAFRSIDFLMKITIDSILAINGEAGKRLKKAEKDREKLQEKNKELQKELSQRKRQETRKQRKDLESNTRPVWTRIGNYGRITTALTTNLSTMRSLADVEKHLSKTGGESVVKLTGEDCSIVNQKGKEVNLTPSEEKIIYALSYLATVFFEENKAIVDQINRNMEKPNNLGLIPSINVSLLELSKLINGGTAKTAQKMKILEDIISISQKRVRQTFKDGKNTITTYAPYFTIGEEIKIETIETEDGDGEKKVERKVKKEEGERKVREDLISLYLGIIFFYKLNKRYAPTPIPQNLFEVWRNNQGIIFPRLLDYFLSNYWRYRISAIRADAKERIKWGETVKKVQKIYNLSEEDTNKIQEELSIEARTSGAIIEDITPKEREKRIKEARERGLSDTLKVDTFFSKLPTDPRNTSNPRKTVPDAIKGIEKALPGLVTLGILTKAKLSANEKLIEFSYNWDYAKSESEEEETSENQDSKLLK